jgi:prefoldin subunit 5
MQDKLQQRLQQLKTEYEAGQKVMADLQAKQANLRDTILRISGAIQVLEEILSEVPVETTPVNGEGSTEAIPTEVTTPFS